MSIATGGSFVTRSPSVPADMVFNLASELEIVALLRRIHLSILSIEEKNHLRDLVFATRFSNSPVDTNLIQTFASYGFAIVFDEAAVVAPVPTVVNNMTVTPPTTATPAARGFSRQTPKFTAILPTAVIQSPEIVSEPLAPPVESPSGATVSFDAPVVVSIPAVETPILSEATPNSVLHEQLISVPVPVPTPEPTPEPTPTPEPEPEPTPVPVPEPVVLAEIHRDPPPIAKNTSIISDKPIVDAMPVIFNSAEAVERITAIKREVNAAVGNPVSLIDVNNTIGREYMSALLDAMKKTTGAVAAQEIERAMARLERAYEAVQTIMNPSETLLEKEAAVLSPASVNVVDSASAIVPGTSELHTSPDEEEIKVQIGARSSEPSEPVSENTLPATKTPTTSELTQRRTLPVVPADEVDANKISADTVLITSTIKKPTRSDTQNSELEAAAVVAKVPVEIIAAETANVESDKVPVEILSTYHDTSAVPLATKARDSGITSVAKERQLKELMEERTAAELVADIKHDEQVAQNPLLADEVTSGLHQLLSEWKLFKSSGIFGTGPSGFEHPLYKKISQLNMAVLLAGRFEGATADIKRSISDYMNGWRYEEGIMHEPGETFEMYLRRVIRHILDNQVKK